MFGNYTVLCGSGEPVATGGQPDFAIGTLPARKGRSVTILRSTRKQGALGCIIPQLDQGTVVTVPRQFGDIVITEHGVADASWARATASERRN